MMGDDSLLIVHGLILDIIFKTSNNPVSLTVSVWALRNRFSRSSISFTVIPFSFHSTTKKTSARIK